MWLNKIISHRAARNDPGIFRQIPLAGRGRLYVSPMPFGAYDTGNRIFNLYREHKIDHVFIIATDDEIKRKARRDLKRDYERIGAGHSQIAIQDMTAPDLEELRARVDEAEARLAGHRIAVHCHAGVGRTSVFVCCVAQKVLGLAPEASIAYVKKHMEVDMTSEQESVVRRFGGKART